jgi:hypothetical protein
MDGQEIGGSHSILIGLKMYGVKAVTLSYPLKEDIEGH